MISFSDHYNALFVDRIPSKTKIGKDFWLFHNSLLEKHDFCVTIKNLLAILKTKRNNHISTSDW